ncbi:ATP-binding protein [Streptomyces sp. NPDC057620]|uniref:ATP-binding protein n=1 Tax=Streptomyces sp. NPDC057620 TaxID=3346185 RepID=UPI0036BE237F
MTVTATPRPTGHPGYSQTLERVPESAGAARSLVRTALAAWQQDGLIEDALCVITELVSNAVDHACCSVIRVVVTRPADDRVLLAVVDRSRDLPRTGTDRDAERLRGRGLVLVDALSDRWGTEPHRWGKTVWAELSGEPAAGG